MKEKIKIKPSFKTHLPHRPTMVHKNKKKYTRKGKVKIIKKILLELESEDNG